MKLVLVLALLAGCSGNPGASLPANLDDRLMAAEGVRCADITAHDPGVLAPDCQKLWDAFSRGRERAKTRYPQASGMKMSSLTLYRTALQWNDGEGFPRIGSGAGQGAMAATFFCNQVNYAFEETVEHETLHVAGCMYEGLAQRTPEAMAAPKDADQVQFTLFYQIFCHNTTDDPFGDGTSLSASGRASCILPYSGLPKDARIAQEGTR